VRFSQAMHIDLQTLAEQAHVHRNTISRAPSSRGVQDFLREALRVIKAATEAGYKFIWIYGPGTRGAAGRAH